VISTTLNERGEIVHVSDFARISFGERSGARSERAAAIETAFSAARFDLRLSDTIVQEMWEKWVFIASMAGITCLLRATIGELVAAGGTDLATTLVAECAAVAASYGFAPSESALRRNRAMLTDGASPLTSSMHRDLERGGATEVEHLIGDLLRLGNARAIPTPLLRAAYVHLNAYERRRVPGSRSLH
jgi:2-dehydropantoate 2-reductase